jgi:phosphate acetyltransferase
MQERCGKNFDVPYHTKLDWLFAKKLDNIKPIGAAIICPYTQVSLGGALLAFEKNIIDPILIGEATKIHEAAKILNKDISSFRHIEASEDNAVALAIELLQKKSAHMIVKGSLHTTEFMRTIVRSTDLRTKRRMSHCQLYDVPIYKKLLLITDPALNVFPTLMEKKDIIQNAIDLAIKLGITQPKVALLSAAEEVNPHIPSTTECVKLCEMASAGQIIGGIVEGPLSFDLAISESSVEIKKLKTRVGGDADILFAPNIEVGNILIKSLDYFGRATGLGVVLGAAAPVVLTSRSADIFVRAMSCLLARFVNDN